MNKIENIKYHAKPIEDINNGDGYWNYQKIGIFENEQGEEKQIGEYIRNYHNFYQTFFAFKQDDKWYALYSNDYTSIRVMSLPDCKDLGGDEHNTWGFCPTGIYVPFEDRSLNYYYKQFKQNHPEIEPIWPPGSFGFICGCVWGDDHSWKIRFVDLREIEKGILKTDARFGYIELLGGPEKLKQAFDFGDFDYGDKYDDWDDQDDESLGRIQIECRTSFCIHKRY